MPGTNPFATLASNSTGSLWVIHFRTMPGITGPTVLNLVPDALPVLIAPTNISDGDPGLLRGLGRLVRRRLGVTRTPWTGLWTFLLG